MGLIVLLLVIYLIYSGLRESFVFYLNPGELIQKSNSFNGKVVRLAGKVVQRSVSIKKNSLINFKVSDSSQTIEVTFQGKLPDTFRENSEVVLEGVYSTQTQKFKATQILTKCPSKYEPKE